MTMRRKDRPLARTAKHRGKVPDLGWLCGNGEPLSPRWVAFMHALSTQAMIYRTPQQIADTVGISRQAVCKWMPRLPGIRRVGNRWRIPSIYEDRSLWVVGKQRTPAKAKRRRLSPAVAARIESAASLIGSGKPFQEAAEALNVTRASLYKARLRHPYEWDLAETKARRARESREIRLQMSDSGLRAGFRAGIADQREKDLGSDPLRAMPFALALRAMGDACRLRLLGKRHSRAFQAHLRTIAAAYSMGNKAEQSALSAAARLCQLRWEADERG